MFVYGDCMAVCSILYTCQQQVYTFVYKLSKKRNNLSLSIAFIFSKFNMCKYFSEHHQIQQLRHKLNKFHRHVANIN